jgi:hypothetical protein
MKLTSTEQKFGLVLASLCLTGMIQAQGALLVYEGFNGYEEGSMGGQTVQNTVGLSGSYYASGSTITYQNTGLTFGGLAVSGGSIIASSNAQNYLEVDLSASATGTLYTGYLVNFSVSNRDDFSAARLGVNPDADAGTGRYFNSNADSADGGYPLVGYGTSLGTNDYTPFNEAGTFLVLARFTNVGTELSGGNPGVATMWILTESQFTYFTSNNLLNDATLDAAAKGSDADDVRYRISGAVTSGTYDLSGSALQLTLAGTFGGSPFTMDEIRFGTTLADVAPVPEPGTAVVCGLGAAFLLMRRNGRRSGF